MDEVSTPISSPAPPGPAAAPGRTGPTRPAGATATVPRPRHHPSVSTLLARDRLGVSAVVFFVLAQVAPLTVAAGVLPTFWAVTGITGAPVVFAAVAVVLAAFSFGYLSLSRVITHAGGLYAFTTHGLGRTTGTGTALVAVGTYNLLQLGLYGMLGPATAELVAGLTGRHYPWWGYSLLAWLIVALLGLWDVRLSGRVLAVLSAAEVLLLLVLAAAGLTHPAGAGVDTSTLDPSHLFAPGIGAAVVIAVLGFVGFEGAPVLSEETRRPTRTVPAATFTALAVMAAVYILVAWAMATHYGAANLSRVAQDGPVIVFQLAGPDLIPIGQALLVTSLLAAALAFHNAVNRITFTLGRERIFPAALGWTGRRGGAPYTASLVQSALAAVVIAGYAVSGTDPVVHLFYFLGTTGGFGVLLLISVTSIAVTVYQVRSRAFVPASLAAAATVALLAMSALAASSFPTLLSLPMDSALAWSFPAGYLVLAALGVLLAIRLRGRDPQRYQRLGTPVVGAGAAQAAQTAQTAQTAPEPAARAAGNGVSW